MNIKGGFAAVVVIYVLASFVQNASAQNSSPQNTQTENSTTDNKTSPRVNKSEADKNKYQKNFKSDGDAFVDRLMQEIPYSKSLRYTWNVIDGDVDLYFEDLRVDRKNRGLTYTMDSLPMVGEMKGAELKAMLGEDNKLTFKSDYMPFVGHVEGFQLKMSAGTDDSNISLRYKTAISW